MIIKYSIKLSKNNEYKISIIIPCYNEKYSIYEIINKINKLKIHRNELVDDYSVDGTRLIIKNKLENLLIKLYFMKKQRKRCMYYFSNSTYIWRYCNNSRCRS